MDDNQLDATIASITDAIPDIVEKLQDDVKTLREFTSVQYGQQYLLEKKFPTFFAMVKKPGIIGFSQFIKIRLLDPRGSSCLFERDQHDYQLLLVVKRSIPLINLWTGTTFHILCKS